MGKMEGVVVGGRRLGRELGFPTANIEVNERTSDPDGVYVARVRWKDSPGWVAAVANLGQNPSVGGCERRLECHLLDYSGESLYGVRLEVELLQLLREERCFENLTALKEQIARDIAAARKSLATQKGE